MLNYWYDKGQLLSYKMFFNEVVPNIEERKAEFVTLHNELRVLLGKEQRKLKNTTDNLTQKSEQMDEAGLDGTNTHGNTHEQIKQSN